MEDPFATNVTLTTHREPYPSIDPTRPELSQAGKTILITGGTAGIGLATAKAFIAASASVIIITGRRQEQLDAACAELNEGAIRSGNRTHIIGRRSDAIDPTAIDTLWTGLAEIGISVDVLVLNAAKFTIPKPLLDLSTDEISSLFETNVRGPIQFASRFYYQVSARDRPKVGQRGN
jgi:NAD(P)-dependent dehydrogenase (short-subunit alcohol dehydrogenase family)